MISNEELVNIDLKSLIEGETGQKFDRNNKITSPFNPGEKTPSFSIYFNSNQNKWMFKDFSSGEVGDHIDFIEKFKGMNYKQAREYLKLPCEKTLQELQFDKIEKYINWQIKHQENKKGYELIGLFPFTDSNNNVLYYKAKFKKTNGKKDISYYHLDSDNVINTRGCEEVPYNLYSTLQAIKNNDIIIITEGERNANKLNNLLKKGYCATSVKGIRELNKLGYFNGCKIYVCGDSGEAGEKYKQHIYNELFRDSKEFKFIRLLGLNKMPDNSDVEDWLDAGHNRSDLLEAFNRSLDLKNIYELQQDKHGIYKLVKESNGEEETYKRKYISNFRVISATSLNYVDKELNNIEIIFKDEYGKEIKRNGNVVVLEDLRSFKYFINSMNLTFEGKADDLIKLKKWINTYFIDDYCEIYNGNQFRKINNELLFISSSGAIGINKVHHDIKSDEKTNNNISNIGPMDKEELQELMQHLFKFSDYKNTYSIIGTVINDLAIYQGIRTGTKFSHLLIVGGAGSGKSTIIERVVAELLNYDISNIKSMSTTSFAIDKILSTGNYPVIFDEYKPSKFTDSKNKALSDTFRISYDRREKEKGDRNQNTNSYKLNSPIIMAGEENFKGKESAAIERSCIVYLSKEERTQEHTDSMYWIINNNSLLNKLGKALILKILSISADEYKTIRQTIENKIKNCSFLKDRVLTTAIGSCAGIEILNMVLCDYQLPVINDYYKFITDNLKSEVLDNGKDTYSEVEKMLIKFMYIVSNDKLSQDKNNIMYFNKKNDLHIKTKEILPEIRIYLDRTKDRKTSVMDEDDFIRQVEKSKYLIKKSVVVKPGGKTKRMDLYDIEKINKLISEPINGEELQEEPLTEKEISMFDK